MQTLQQMIDAAVANGGGTVVVPGGDHLIAETLVLDGSRVHLTGEGPQSRLIGQDAGTDVLVVRGTHHRVSNLAISRADNPESGAFGVHCYNARYVRFENLHFEFHGTGLKVGIENQTTLDTQHVRISNCWFTPRFDAVCIHFLSGADYAVDGCFLEPWKRGIVMSGNSNGIFVSNTSVINGGSYDYGIVSEGDGFARYILGCNIENALHQQIFIGSLSSRITVANCWLGAGDLQGNTRSGIQIEPGAEAIKIIGNRIGDQRLFGIISRGSNVVIQANDLAGNVNTGANLPSILIEGGEHVLVTGNRVSSQAQACGIALRDLDNNQIRFCMIQNNDLFSRRVRAIRRLSMAAFRTSRAVREL